MKKYILLLEENLNEEKEINLFKYFKSYWLYKKGLEFINNLEYIKPGNNFKLKYLFFTNKIIESFHGKLNKYLPKGKTSSKGFLLTINNILDYSELQKEEIKRHDFKIQTIIKLAQNYNNNNIKFKWILYEDFYRLEKEISINLYKNEENKDNINEILNDIR